MDADGRGASFRLKIFAVVVMTCSAGTTWAAEGDVCVDDGMPGVRAGQICNGPTTTVNTANQDLNTGTGSIITTDVTASGTVQGATLTDGAGTTISGGDIDADSGTIDNLDGDSASFDTFDDGTVTLSGGSLSDGSNAISMDGMNATVDLENGDNALSFDSTGGRMSAGNGTTTGSIGVDAADGSADMTATDGTTTGSVSVTESSASVSVDNGTATHGLTVGTSDTVLSGGTASTALTLDDAGAHLDNNLDMGGNRVTNMADGIHPMDAVNKRQLDDVEDNLESAVSAVAAMAALPAPLPGDKYSIGLGAGFYNSESAIAAGVNANLTDHLRLKGALGFSSSERVGGVGIGYSW